MYFFYIRIESNFKYTKQYEIKRKGLQAACMHAIAVSKLLTSCTHAIAYMQVFTCNNYETTCVQSGQILIPIIPALCSLHKGKRQLR